MQALMRGLERVIHAMLWITLIIGVIMMIHVSIDVTARAFLIPVVGTNEIVSAYYMILIVYLPWAYITQGDNHICADIFVRHIPPSIMSWLDIAIKLLTLAYVSIFAWQTWLRAIQQMRNGEAMQVVTNYLPVWPSRFALPFSAGLMALYLVLRISSDIRDTVSGKTPRHHDVVPEGDGL